MFRRRRPEGQPKSPTEEQGPADMADDPVDVGSSEVNDGSQSAPATPFAEKGQAMSASTPPRAPGQGVVPEIPRRSAADIPGAPVRRPSPALAESKRLVVGREISLTGEITACDTLVVEGTVEATLENSQLLEISESGSFKGRVQIEDATIGGRFEGDLTVRRTLTVKSGGRIEGTIRFGKLEVELGGELKGDIAPIGPEGGGV